MLHLRLRRATLLGVLLAVFAVPFGTAGQASATPVDYTVIFTLTAGTDAPFGTLTVDDANLNFGMPNASIPITGFQFQDSDSVWTYPGDFTPVRVLIFDSLGKPDTISLQTTDNVSPPSPPSGHLLLVQNLSTKTWSSGGNNQGTYEVVVPEPGSLTLLGLGLVGLAALRRRCRPAGPSLL